MNARASAIEAAKTATRDVYERQARTWDRQRPRSLYEKPWLDRFAARIPPGGRLLDLGCGAGDPVGTYFIGKGFALVGVDYSETMIALARERHSGAEWHVQDMRMLDASGPFDGICSWDGFFHLSVEEQRAALPDLANRIGDGGAMLLTVGPGEGEVTGTVGGETVYHASLSEIEYRDILRKSGFRKIAFVAEDAECGGRSVLMAWGKQTV
ncbi:class I SAM-dependent methyltransferase [Parasphingopyxis algicola]|uniref:class I SAM-dependent DNA methyltransferase n=1 Tax=Parasphingopyxis algicola TaxID=2026624 RepID=UPI0015A49CF5|nr:class I SAM-dependent methyltransferase [Parasphingopyxis algicola]QLC24959.1 class I SAM-dependent methyltransferase [Parasphingopyxis algicola]